MATFADFAEDSLSGILPTLSLGDAGTRNVACAGDWVMGVYGVRGVLIRGGMLEVSVYLSLDGVDIEDDCLRAGCIGASVEGLLVASPAMLFEETAVASPGRDAGLCGSGGSDIAGTYGAESC